jgi:HAMP domain-containing protein
MATERVTERSDGLTNERVVERDAGGTTYVDRGGSGVGGVIIGIAVLALVAIVAFFLLSANRNDAIRTDAVTSAASSVADSAGSAAQSVGDAANSAADSVSR